MFDRHTSENIFNLVSTFLNVVCPNWRAKLIGIGSDGANVMTGHMQGVVTRLEQQVQGKLYRTSCGLHQLDLVMSHGYEKLMDGELLTIMNAFIAHLRQQTNLIIDMKATCPKLANRWIVMGNVCSWLLEKRIRLFQYIEGKQPSQAPPNWWWIVVAGIDAFTAQVNIVFVKLQAKDLLVSQQSAELNTLASLLCIQLGIEGPHSEDDLAALNQATNVIQSRWSVSHYNILQYLFDQGMFVRELFRLLDPPLQLQVINMVGQLVLDVMEGVLEIQTERDSNNNPVGDLPPTLPHELAKIRGSAFGDILSMHIDQLNMDFFAIVESQHSKLVSAYQNESALKLALDKCDHRTSFETGWGIVEGRFNALRDFCGGIATVFANTATVESDFSILGWEKDEYRMSLTDLSLEGIMQCKQFELLSQLA